MPKVICHLQYAWPRLLIIGLIPTHPIKDEVFHDRLDPRLVWALNSGHGPIGCLPTVPRGPLAGLMTLNTPQPAAPSVRVASYMSAIQELYGSQPWSLIEPHAEYTWGVFREEGDPDWPEVRDRLAAIWPIQTDRPR